MDELKLDFEALDNVKINIDDGFEDTGIKLSEDDSSMLGVELLANSNSKADLTTTNDISGGYSSDDGSSKSIKINDDSDRKNKYDFFDKNNDVKKIETPSSNTKSVPIDDPIINNAKENQSSLNGDFKPMHSMNPQEIKNEKIDFLYKFQKLESQGIRTTMNYNMNSHLEDMRNEYIKLKKQREVDNSVKFQRKVMMAIITGVEFLNNKFDPFDVKLDGWSESINENIYDYDEVFEELSEKYGGTTEVAPELKLLMMLGGSAFMFHLTNTMFKSSIPGMEDIMKQNPELMTQFAKAAVGSIGKQPPSQPQRMNVNTPPQRHPQQPPPQMRREMNAPNGLDEIMGQINEIPDLDNISISSGDTDRRSNSGITLNL
jgi:hypothetical protein